MQEPRALGAWAHLAYWRWRLGLDLQGFMDPGIPSGRIMLRRALYLNSKVACFIAPDHMWDINLLYRTFLLNGEYTVKLEYQVGYNAIQSDSMAPGPLDVLFTARWSKWMALHISQKIKVFLWRLMHDFLPI